MNSSAIDRHFNKVLQVVLALAFVILFLPFLQEILLAIIFACALYPLLRRLCDRRIFHRRYAALTTLLLLLFLIVGPIFLATYKVFLNVQALAAKGLTNSEFFQDVNRLRDVTISFLDRLSSRFHIEPVDLSNLSAEFIDKTSQSVLKISTVLISNIPTSILSIFVFSCALYYFLDQAPQIKQAFQRSRLIPQGELNDLILILQDSCSSTVLASTIMGFIQAATVTLGSLIFRAGDAVVIFIGTFFVSFIPVIGAAPVALVLALLKFAHADYGSGIGLLVFAALTGTIDNVVRPWLVSGQEQNLHPIVALLSLLGAILIFGFSGLFIGPVVASITFKYISMRLYQ